MDWEEENWARQLRAADYSFRQWLQSPMIQKLLAMNASGVAAAANAKLAAGITHLRHASLIVGAAELALTLGVPIAVWVGVFAAMGAPYAQAKALVKNENFQSGFSRGFVAGLLKWEWDHVTARFFRFSPGVNTFDATLGYIAANATNDGLHAGYIHASSVSGDVRKALLGRLRSLSPSTQAGQWDRRSQIDYVIELAAAGRRHRVFVGD